MPHFEDEHEVAELAKFRAVRPIIEKHFAAFQPGKIVEMTKRFIATEEVALYECWNYNKQQKCLSGLRTQLQKASEYLKGIHPVVLQEVHPCLGSGHIDLQVDNEYPTKRVRHLCQ